MNAEVVESLCEQGLDAEMSSRHDAAASAYQNAWDRAESSYDKSIAAHYQARVASQLDDRLRWTRLSVENAAEAADDGDQRIFPLLPTLQIAYASALLSNGDHDIAQRVYLAASDALDSVSGDSAQLMVLQSTIYEGLRATGFVPQGASSHLVELVASLKSADAWGPLAVVLAAFVRNTGSDQSAGRFVLSLRELFAAGLLRDVDQELLGRAITSAQEQIVGSIDATANIIHSNETPARVSSGYAPDSADDDPFGDSSPNVALRI